MNNCRQFALATPNYRLLASVNRTWHFPCARVTIWLDVRWPI